jgi:hypothetical protein
MKKSKSVQLIESAQPERSLVRIRSRIGRYLCADHSFRHELEKARKYSSVAGCLSAISQMTPERRENLLKRGAHLEIIVTSSINLPSSIFENKSNEPS